MQQVKSQSRSYTKTGWLTFIISLLLTIGTPFIWGNGNSTDAHPIPVIVAVLIVLVVAWKSLSINMMYDRLERNVEVMSSILRTYSLKRVFPQYANNPLVNKVAKEEAETQSKINETNKNIKKQKRYIKLLVLVQALIIIGGFVNMNRIAENKRAAYRVQQERILEQERQEQQRQAEEKRIAKEKFEEEQRQLEPTKKWILSQLEGKIYTGKCWMNKGIRIYFLNKNTLHFSTTTEFQHDNSKWSDPMSIPFSIDIKKESLGVSSWYSVIIRSREFYSDEINIYDDKFNPFDLQIKYKDENYTLHREY